MAMDDYVESEVAVAVAATAAVLSPRVRRWIRRGAVYGLAGALVAKDAVATFAQGVARGIRHATSEAEAAAQAGGERASVKGA
jgi:hypothetical protein